MIKDDEKIVVKNNINAVVTYIIPDMNNLVRVFEPKSQKTVTAEELRKLSYEKGGLITLQKYLFIDNEELVKELLGDVEPEYFYSEKDIKELLLNGDINQFEDFLVFAPDGLKDTVKDLAVTLQLNDVKKRELIKKYLSFDVTAAINLLESIDEDTDLTTKKPQRKASTPNKPQRKYKVVK